VKESLQDIWSLWPWAVGILAGVFLGMVIFKGIFWIADEWTALMSPEPEPTAEQLSEEFGLYADDEDFPELWGEFYGEPGEPGEQPEPERYFSDRDAGFWDEKVSNDDLLNVPRPETGQQESAMSEREPGHYDTDIFRLRVENDHLDWCQRNHLDFKPFWEAAA
jgi:hypothetical protein